jgi:hypothetical protein
VADEVTSNTRDVWIAAVFEQLLENVVVLARESDKQLGLVEEDSKVSQHRAGCAFATAASHKDSEALIACVLCT